MRVLTEIGELGVSIGDRDYLFRPSLAAMSSLGTPAEIVELFAFMQQPFSKRTFFAAIPVLWACCDEDVSALTGYQGSRWHSWVPGALPAEDVVVLARSLLRHGITGDSTAERSGEKGEYSVEFNARDFAIMAMAHLGMSESDAWNCTMTSLTAAMRSKFPPQKDGKLTLKEADDTMAWYEEVKRKRASK